MNFIRCMAFDDVCCGLKPQNIDRFHTFDTIVRCYGNLITIASWFNWLPEWFVCCETISAGSKQHNAISTRLNVTNIHHNNSIINLIHSFCVAANGQMIINANFALSLAIAAFALHAKNTGNNNSTKIKNEKFYSSQ